MTKGKVWRYLAVLAVLSSLSVHCGDDGDEGVTGGVVAFSTCKDFNSGAGGIINARGLPPNQAGVDYQYDGMDRLVLEHVNAGFNCCPGEVLARVESAGDTIEVHEEEQQTGCRCNCLYDVSVEIRGVEQGQYTIKLVEPYLNPGNEPLEFSVDLRIATQGSHVVDRSGYPWEG